MEPHFELSDELFEQQFEAGTINPATFTHEAHLRLAYIHIKKYGVERAIENIGSQLLSFVERLGVRDKYNKTLTVAGIRAVNHFVKRSVTSNFSNLLLEFPRLKNNFKGLMAAHYGTDIFNSTLAKEQYLKPDLLPFS